MDLSAPITMKNAAKCDMQCELQNSASHQIFERNWRWEDILLACLFQCVVHIINHNAIEGISILSLVKKESIMILKLLTKRSLFRSDFVRKFVYQ